MSMINIRSIKNPDENAGYYIFRLVCFDMKSITEPYRTPLPLTNVYSEPMIFSSL